MEPRHRLGLALPRVEMLNDDEWRRRNFAVRFVAIVATLVSFTVGHTVAGVDLWHGLLEIAPVVLPALVARLVSNRIVAAVLTTTSILVSTGLMVHYTDGLIEAHFGFFVLLPAIALFHDWRPFVYAVLFVAGTHGVMGYLDPTSMYNHIAAIEAPITWGLIHAAYVLALSGLMIVHWNFGERPRLELERALGELTIANEQLARASRLESIGQLAAGVAHEINTPMQYIGDNVSFLRKAFERIDPILVALEELEEGDHERRAVLALQLVDEMRANKVGLVRGRIPKAIDQSLDGVGSVSKIVRAMKDFSHPGTEAPQAYDLNQSIETTLTVCRNEWKYVAEVETDLEPDLPLLSGYPGEINQVILNMVVNAAHAIADADSDGKGSIRLVTRRDEDCVILTISDTGTGVPPGVVDRIFDPFFTTKEVGRGTGQGLAISHQVVVVRHGGAIGVESRPGEGSTFTIRLPVGASRRPAEEPTPVGA